MKGDLVYLEHILECIEQIEEYTQGDKQLFLESPIVQDAALRRLQTMAESSQRISKSLKSSENQIDWRAISGFRNILVHDYLGLDLELVWRVIEKRLPELSVSIKIMIETFNDDR